MPSIPGMVQRMVIPLFKFGERISWI
jgi:hypothetical protein